MYRDPVLSMLTLFAGAYLSQYLSRQPNRPIYINPSDCITFEDVFGLRREVPLAYFATHHILSGFFQSHYEGTSVAELVSNGQYSLLPGRYAYNQLYDLHSITTEKVVQGRKIITAIRYRASQTRCLDCMNKLKKHPTGGYVWFVIVNWRCCKYN